MAVEGNFSPSLEANAIKIESLFDFGGGRRGIVRNMFPGVSLRSIDKAESRRTARAIKDIEMVNREVDRGRISPEDADELKQDILYRHGRRANLDGVMRYAEENMGDDADPSKVDPNWVEEFRDHAEKVSDDAMQRTWGMVLAGELDSPGSFSKRTMTILADMDGRDAKLFEHACALLVSTLPGKKYPLALPLEPDDSTTSYNGGTVAYGDLSHLASLGLLGASSKNFGVPPGAAIAFFYGEGILRSTVVANASDSEKTLVLHGFQLTASGEQLARLCEIGTDPGIPGRVRRIAEGQGFAVAETGSGR